MVKKNFRIKFLFHYLFCLLVISLKGQISAIQAKTQIEQLLQSTDFENSTLGVCLKEVNTGKTLFEYNSKKSLVPASTLKVLTTGAALGILGKNFQYKTKLVYTGEIDLISGTLSGDLIIVGSGDPSLGSQYFRKKNDSNLVLNEFAEALQKKGIKKIIGNIIADNSCFENDLPDNWIWSDLGNYYGAGTNGLSYMDNKFSVYFSSHEIGSSAKLLPFDSSQIELSFEYEVIAEGKKDNAIVYGSPKEKIRKITGFIPPFKDSFEVEAALPDPALFLAKSLKKHLIKKGIAVDGNCAVEKNLQLSKELCVHLSPTLEKIVFYCNLKSNNHYAESLIKTLGFFKNKKGTTHAGVKVVEDFWKNKGIETKGIFISDGSGLSRSNGISAEQQSQILLQIRKDTNLFQSFYASLPIAGISGSLTGFGKGTAMENNLHAKSGYIERVRAYCGYFTNQSKQECSVSLLLNNYSCSPASAKLLLEKVMLILWTIK